VYKYIGIVVGILFVVSLLNGCIDSKYPDEIAQELEQEILQITPPDMEIQDAIETLFQISDSCFLTVCNDELKLCFSRYKSLYYDKYHLSEAYAPEPPRIRGKCKIYVQNLNMFAFFRKISTNPNPIEVYASYTQVGDKWLASDGYSIYIRYDFILSEEINSRDILTPYNIAKGYGLPIFPNEEITYFIRIDNYPAPPDGVICRIDYNNKLLLWETPYRFVPRTFTFLDSKICNEGAFDPYLLTFSSIFKEYPIDFHVRVISSKEIEEYIYTLDQSDEIISIQKIK